MAFNPIEYVKESKSELNKVVWPTKQETLRMSIVVIAISLLVGAYIAGLDAVFTTLVEKLLKIK